VAGSGQRYPRESDAARSSRVALMLGRSLSSSVASVFDKPVDLERY